MSSVKINTSWTFEAAHQLHAMPDGHKCRRLHGHSYEVVFEVRMSADKDGMTVEYGELRAIVERLDHRYLNEIEGLASPTTENVAAWILAEAEKLPSLSRDPGTDITVRVFEGAHRHCASVHRQGF